MTLFTEHERYKRVLKVSKFDHYNRRLISYNHDSMIKIDTQNNAVIRHIASCQCATFSVLISYNYINISVVEIKTVCILLSLWCSF